MRFDLNRLSYSSGWKSCFMLLLAGALTAAALAPFYLWPLLIPGFSILFLQLQGAPTPRAAFWRGWWWGFGFFLAGLYWIAIALTVDMARFGWMIPFALAGLNGGFALFTALSAWLYRRFQCESPTRNLLWFTLALFAGEWLRGHILTGFPWNLIGYSWGASDISAQSAALVGVYGLTFITPFMAASIVLLAVGRWWPTLVSSLLLICLCAYGWHRLDNASLTDSGTVVRIVQANIAQSMKWEPGHMQAALDEHIALSQAKGEKPVDIIVWPETAFPYVIAPDSPWLSQIGTVLDENQLLIAGAVVSNGEVDSGNLKLWNSALVINASGQVVQRYDKRHLVPFGEYMPLRHWLPIEKITPGTIDFSHGENPAEITLGTKGGTARALICYEVAFPKYSGGKEHADWLVNLTNDGWYGNSSGPYQHREMARFRAIEQGIPILRAANTGISVAYDPYGRILGEIPYGDKGFLDVRLPLGIH